jgi:dolichol kinase
MVQDEDLHDETLPLFTFTLILPIIFIGVTILISTGIGVFFRLIKKNKDFTELESGMERKLKVMSKVKFDIIRKINHVIIFIALFIVWYLSYNMIKDFTQNEGKNQDIKIDPKITNMLYLYLRLLTKPNSIENVMFSLEWFYYVLFFFFYILSLIMLANEFTRKTKYMSFPFNLIKIIISEEEKKSYSTYLYFGIGQMFAAFLCPPMVFFAILGMSSIGDLMTSQVGIRYGKRQISWNPKKTYEGTLAGTITSLIISVIFIGPLYGMILAGAFMIFDMFTNKPINLSDNLLIPIGCAIIYVFVRYIFDIDYVPIILQYV